MKKIPIGLRRKLEKIEKKLGAGEKRYDVEELLVSFTTGTYKERVAKQLDFWRELHSDRPQEYERIAELYRKETAELEKDWRESGEILQAIGISYEEHMKKRFYHWMLLDKWEVATPEERELMRLGHWMAVGGTVGVYVGPKYLHGVDISIDHDYFLSEKVMRTGWKLRAYEEYMAAHPEANV